MQSATIIVSAIILLKADIVLSLIIFSLIPIYIATYKLNRAKMYIAHTNYKEKANEYFSKCSEQINKLAFIKRNVLNVEMENRLSRSFSDMNNSALHAISVDYIFANLNQFVIVLAYLCIVGLGGYKVSIGLLSIGYFSIINIYFNMIIRSISYFIGLSSSFQDARISFERIDNIMNSDEEYSKGEIIDSVQNIQIKNLSFDFGDQIIFNQYDFRFEIGKIYGIKGQNGCGKTTLLNLVIGIINGNYIGNIFYNNIELEKINLIRFRREKVAYLEQAPVFLNMSVRDFLNLGLEVNEKVQYEQAKLLKLLNVEYLFDKQINENGTNLSGGERQKLALVRVLSKESSLILLDEPTSALDKESTAQLMNILMKRKENATILVISHDPNVLDNCDTVVKL